MVATNPRPLVAPRHVHGNLVHESAQNQSDLRADTVTGTRPRTNARFVFRVRRRLSESRETKSDSRWRRLLEGDETRAARFSRRLRSEQQLSRSLLRHRLFIPPRRTVHGIAKLTGCSETWSALMRRLVEFPLGRGYCLVGLGKFSKHEVLVSQRLVEILNCLANFNRRWPFEETAVETYR